MRCDQFDFFFRIGRESISIHSDEIQENAWHSPFPFPRKLDKEKIMPSIFSDDLDERCKRWGHGGHSFSPRPCPSIAPYMTWHVLRFVCHEMKFNTTTRPFYLVTVTNETLSVAATSLKQETTSFARKKVYCSSQMQNWPTLSSLQSVLRGRGQNRRAKANSKVVDFPVSDL